MTPHTAFLLGAVTLALIGSGLAGISDGITERHKSRRWRRRTALLGAYLTLLGAWLAINTLNVWGHA